MPLSTLDLCLDDCQDISQQVAKNKNCRNAKLVKNLSKILKKAKKYFDRQSKNKQKRRNIKTVRRKTNSKVKSLQVTKSKRLPKASSSRSRSKSMIKSSTQRARSLSNKSPAGKKVSTNVEIPKASKSETSRSRSASRSKSLSKSSTTRARSLSNKKKISSNVEIPKASKSESSSSRSASRSKSLSKSSTTRARSLSNKKKVSTNVEIPKASKSESSSSRSASRSKSLSKPRTKRARSISNKSLAGKKVNTNLKISKASTSKTSTNAGRKRTSCRCKSSEPTEKIAKFLPPQIPELSKPKITEADATTMNCSLEVRNEGSEMATDGGIKNGNSSDPQMNLNADSSAMEIRQRDAEETQNLSGVAPIFRPNFDRNMGAKEAMDTNDNNQL